MMRRRRVADCRRPAADADAHPARSDRGGVRRQRHVRNRRCCGGGLAQSGGNDFLRRRPPAAVKADVRRLVQSVRQRGAQAVRVAVPHVSLRGIVSGAKRDATRRASGSWPGKKVCSAR